jgi:acyl-coenzyme A thioesterase PaaI-like protein
VTSQGIDHGVSEPWRDDLAAPYGSDAACWLSWADRLPLLAAFGVRCRQLDDGYGSFTLASSPIALNPNGVVAAIGDAAAGTVFMRSVKPGWLPATANLAVQYHLPAILPLTFDTEIIRQGRSMMFCHVTVTRGDGRLSNVCQAVLAVTK